MMVFDVDKLIEALGFADRFPHARMGVETRPIIDAARLAVAGQPLWWCEEHKVSAHNDDECWQQVWGQDDDYTLTRCRMVEWWRMPTGGNE